MTERKPGSCEECGEYGMICLNGQRFLCWHHYCEAMRIARERNKQLSKPSGTTQRETP
jgi:hypothetical protein